ncbi:MAG: helix-turn-helix domain-containing protein, partial [Acidobacteria bacterium]|nr:helix-turn-helix domain-containing protein [Acidobacteriota bacterium]
MARPVSTIELTPEERSTLRPRAHSPTSAQRDAPRARIVLMRAEGRKETDVAAATGVSMAKVSLWSKRFEEKGLDGLVDLPGRGRKPWLDPHK